MPANHERINLILTLILLIAAYVVLAYRASAFVILRLVRKLVTTFGLRDFPNEYKLIYSKNNSPEFHFVYFVYKMAAPEGAFDDGGEFEGFLRRNLDEINFEGFYLDDLMRNAEIVHTTRSTRRRGILMTAMIKDGRALIRHP